MGKDRSNTLALSSKKQCQGWTNHGRELERLRAELEAEKNRKQQAHLQLSVELRHLCEEAEREQQRALRELTARHERQKALELLRLREDLSREWAAEICSLLYWKGQEQQIISTRLEKHSGIFRRQPNKLQQRITEEVNIKVNHCGRASKGKATGKEASCLGSGVTYQKLEQLLLRLHEQVDGEQAGFLLHLRKELELEKAFFLCHLLEAHGRLGQGRQRVGPLSYRSRSCGHLFRNHAQGDGSHTRQTVLPLAYSRSLSESSKSAPPPSKKRTRRESWKLPSGRDLSAADRCPTAVEGDTCRSSSPEICHPQTFPRAGWDPQPSCRSDSPGLDKSSASKCLDENMEDMVRF